MSSGCQLLVGASSWLLPVPGWCQLMVGASVVHCNAGFRHLLGAWLVPAWFTLMQGLGAH